MYGSNENFAKSAKLSLTIGWLAASNVFLVVGFHWYVVTRLGIGVETDALFAAIAIPQLVLAVVSTSLTYVVVPMFATEAEASFRRDAWTIFLIITGLFAALAVALLITSSCFVPFLVTGFSARGKAITVELARIYFAGIALTAAASVASSIYQARGNFVWVEFSSVLSNLSGLALVVMTLPVYGVRAAAWSLVTSNALQLVLLVRVLGRWQTPDLHSDVIRETYRRMRPILLGTAYYKTDPLVDRFLVSMSTTGGISLLYVGQQIIGAINQIIGKAVAGPALPGLAVAAKTDVGNAFKSLYRTRLAWMAVLSLAVYITMLVAGRELLSFFVGHGSVTAENVHSLWLVMIALGGLLTGGALGQVTSLAFYAKGDTRTPTRLGLLTYTLYVPIKILSFLRFGLTGLAASISLFVLVNFALQLVLLERSRTVRHGGIETE